MSSSIGNSLARQGNLIMALGLLGVLSLMIVPVPTGMLDLLLTFNITVAMVVLLVSVYLRQPLDFSVFPSLLLVVTLLRLSLNVASTRLILGEGRAGRVIEAFGDFVVGGNTVIGLVVFIILVIVQFVVITKGATRIAEVAARFTLDAMPGKQMAIDADLGAGLIDEAEARGRRQRIASEAEFYGAMDGASKFVRGDAIAGILITIINIVGGLLVGTLQRGLPLSESVHTYTLLTVGDGLVTQVPALLLSTAAGMVVTRSATGHDLGSDIARQLRRDPRALGVSSFALTILALVPGLPALPFLALAAVTAFGAHRSRRDARARGEEARLRLQSEADGNVDDVPPEEMFVVDRLELRVGPGLVSMLEDSRSALLDRLTEARRATAAELGMRIAPVRLRDDAELPPRAYAFLVRGVEVSRFEMAAGRLLAVATRQDLPPLPGTATADPAFGLTAWWIRPVESEAASAQGYTVADPEAVLVTHLQEVLRGYADEILSRQDVHEMLGGLREYAPTLVNELVPERVSVSTLHGVLQGLLHERVAVRDLVSILEFLAAMPPANLASVDTSVEQVRMGLARQLTRQYADQEGVLWAVTIHPETEQALHLAFRESERTGQVALDPMFADRFVTTMGQRIRDVAASGRTPLVVVNSPLRLFARRLLEASFPTVAILGYGEIAPGFSVRSLGTVIAHVQTGLEMAHAGRSGS